MLSCVTQTLVKESDMSRSVSLLRTATVLFLLVAAASASHAADGVAVVKVTRTTVEWQPLVEYEALLLRIAPPDGLVRQARFAPREVPVVLFDGPQRWPDGVYTYELVVAPRLGEQLRSDLLAARERDDDEELPTTHPG